MSVNQYKNGKLNLVAGASNAPDVLDSYEEIQANTAPDKVAGALGVKELLGGLRFGKDGDGNYGYYGADGSLIPFSSGESGIDFTKATLVDYQSFHTAGTNHKVTFTPDETGLYMFIYIPYCTDTAPTATTNSGITNILFNVGELHRINGTSDFQAIVYSNIVVGTVTAGTEVVFTASGSSSSFADRYRVAFQVYKLPKWTGGGATPEIEIVPLVPTLTSNIGAGGGVASAIDIEDTQYDAYKAFDGNDNTRWASKTSTSGPVNNKWIQYKFTIPTVVNSFSVRAYYADSAPRMKNFTVQASNDGTTFVDLYSDVLANKDEMQTFNFNNNNSYLVYRLYVHDTYLTGTGVAISLMSLQFYGYQLEALVPPMTSNTTPSGEVSASSIYDSSSQPWQAFSGDTTLRWLSSTTSGWLRYKFPEPKKASFMKLLPDYSAGNQRIKECQVFASNDGSLWSELTSILTLPNNQGVTYYIPLSNVNNYLYYELRIYSNYPTSQYNITAVTDIQYYGEPEGVSAGGNNELTKIYVGSIGSASSKSVGLLKSINNIQFLIVYWVDIYSLGSAADSPRISVYTKENGWKNFIGRTAMAEGNILSLSCLTGYGVSNCSVWYM